MAVALTRRLKATGHRDGPGRHPHDDLAADPQPARESTDRRMPAVDDIPVAHTPEGAGMARCPPVLAGCGDALADGAQTCGLWEVVSVEVTACRRRGHRAYGMVQRIEQAGDRVVMTGCGVSRHAL
jgi:hypothetical protein